jgi:selenide, water dikinase
METTYKLTQYSHGAGCGCKIAPQVLDQILGSEKTKIHFPGLLVGNEERDDAAVLDLGDGTAIVSTTDFFMPIVDDAFDFGRIASVNAISDVYAMGGTPILAIAILGWPINSLPAEVANEVVNGARQACADAGIPLAGGHSIDSPEPIFGLAVTGRVKIENLKKNGGASVGSALFLTKGLGVGIFSTAQKKGLLAAEHANLGRDSMVKLNKIGEAAAKLTYVEAMTDVTGFGLLGHLLEMCQASSCSAELYSDQIPILHPTAIDHYIDLNCIPGGSKRNFASYGHKIAEINEKQQALYCDPQTSGGLLIAVKAGFENEFIQFLIQHEIQQQTVIGRMINKTEKVIVVV